METTLKDKAKSTKKETDSVVLSIKITPSEMALIQAKKESDVGEMAPLATYVKKYLRTKTDLLTP